MPFNRLPNPFRPENEDVTALVARGATSPTGNETLPWGLITLAEGVDPVVDIVAVHGLDGHRVKSWTANDVNWLRDLLPTDIPNARIMSWGYDSRTHSFSHIGAKYIYDHGRTLVSDLCFERAVTKTAKRPIIFVAHSLGGIILKSALIHAELAQRDPFEEHRSIIFSTYGVLFMGSPHQGAAGVQLGEVVLRIASIFMATDSRAVRNIERDCEWLQQQLQQYAPISQELVTKFAYELFPTTSIALGKKILIVPQASAVVPGATDGEPIAIAADHTNMVKYASRQDVGYKRVSQVLLLMAEEAPDIVRARWDFTLPFTLHGVPEVDEFVGRNEELSKMSEAFHYSGMERKVVVLQGLGGIGKTQLAVAYLKEHRNTYSAIFWLDGRTEDTLKQSFAATAKRLHREQRHSTLLKMATETEDLDEIVTSIKQWLSIKGNHRWMLVFDSVDNPKIPGNIDPQAYDIRSYFPEASHGSIIITTRTSSLRIGRVLYVRKLRNIQESLAIVASMSGRPTLDQDPHAVKLAYLLDGLPLALATAGAYLGQASTSVEEYIRYYKGSWLKLLRTSPELLSYEDRALYTTWNLSFEHIQAQSVSAAQLLRLWAIFDNQDVWYELLAAGRAKGPQWFSSIVDDELSFNFAMRILCDHGLVEPLNHADGYGMHNCVHAWTQHSLNDIDRVQMRRIALSCVSSSLPREENPEHSVIERRLLPHAARCLDIVISGGNSLDDDYEGYLDDVHNLGLLFQGQGKLKEAEAMYCWALKGKEKALGSDHRSTLETVNNLGALFRDQGKLKEAEIMYQRALEGKERALGPDHPMTLNTVNNLGLLYSDQGRLYEAEKMYQRALEGREKVWGPEHPSTLDTVNNLGLLYNDQGKLKEAEAMYQRALEGKEKAWGPEHTSTLDIVNNLGLLYSDQGKLTEAEAMYQRALEGKEKAWGPDHRSTLDTVHNLGVLYSDQGKLKEAEAMYQRALEGKEKALGPDHFSTLHTVNKIGLLYSGLGKLDEAETMYLRALVGDERALGPDHSMTLNTVNNLGLLYSDQGRLYEAEKMYQRALEGREKAWGPDHTSTLDTVYNLGLLYSNQGRIREAEIMYQRALDGREKALGADHSSALKTGNKLGTLYKNQNRVREAEILYQVVLKGMEEALGSDHLLTLDTFNHLRNIFKDDSKLKEAQARYRRTLDGRERALGKNHMSTLEKVRNILTLYEDQDKLEEAENIHGGSDSGYEGSIQTKAAGHSDTGVDSGYAGSESTGAPVYVVEFDEDGLHDECDIRSVVSNRLEIYSQVGSRKTWQEVAGQRSLSAFMTEIDELRPLYEASLLRMEKHRFINNLRRLLKDFYVDLSLHASTNLERVAINLLRSRASRVAIAQHIAETSELVDEEVRVGYQSLQETASQELYIEAWIAGNKGLTQVPQEPEIAKPALDIAPDPEDHDSDQDSDILCNDEDVERDEIIESLPNIAEVKGFLMRGSPLQNLKNRLLVFLMPAAQSSLTRVLMTIPKNHIWVSHENDSSLSNQIKGFIEDLMEVRWNWWPLRPRMQNLQKGQTRLHWRCHCNTHLWVEISDQDAERYLLLREHKSLISRTDHLCIPRKCTTRLRNPLKDWAVSFFRAAGSHSDPRRAHYASGISPSVPTENLSAANTNSIGDRGGEFTAQGTVLSDEQESRTDSPTSVMNHLIVLFGVQGWRRTLELPQIDARKHNDEDALFRQLREAYRQARGFLRYWFSVWQFSHCDFVKFQKIRARQVISLEKDLPPATEDIYEYNPKPPQATYPPISPHEFKMAFASPCWNICPFYLFHECIEPPQGNFAVDSIPKRKQPWEIEKNERELAWGLQAQQNNIAFFKVFLYHAVPISLGVGFWVCWQRTHPSDLAMATIPVALVMTFIAMLWSSIGVIHALRHAPT